MKKMIMMMAALLTISLNACSQANKTKENKDMKVLVAYFSASGVTKGVAQQLAEVTGGTLHEIKPEQPYTDADLNWRNKQSRSSVEMRDKKSRPAITAKLQNMKDYDIVYVGFPIWWYTCPTIINTFMEAYDFHGKTVIPFATSGGSSIKKACEDLKAAYPNINWKEGKLLNLNTFAQENERLLRNYRDYRERNENRFDWSKSKVFFYLKEYCNHDFSVSHPDVVEFINTCGLEAEQVAGRGMDGIYLNDSFQKLPDLPNNEPNPSNENKGSDRYQMLKKFNIIHLGLKNILQKEVRLDKDTEETSFETISIKELYKIILEEINYWPDMNDVSKDDIRIRRRQVLAEKRLEQYEKDKGEDQVKELENLLSKWQEITSNQLWEKQLLCENSEALQSVVEVKEALRYKENNPLSPGVLVEKGNRIPYKVIDGKLVVDGLCTLVYKDEQFPNATGDSYCYKKYTTNLKLVVKVVNGKAISQTISGTQKWWDENIAVFKKTKGSLIAKAAAMAKAKPVVIKSHNVTKIEDLGFGAELGIMHGNLSSVLGNASVLANSLTDLYKEYLLNPSPEKLNRIQKPFMPVDISALPTR